MDPKVPAIPTGCLFAYITRQNPADVVEIPIDGADADALLRGGASPFQILNIGEDAGVALTDVTRIDVEPHDPGNTHDTTSIQVWPLPPAALRTLNLKLDLVRDLGESALDCLDRLIRENALYHSALVAVGEARVALTAAAEVHQREAQEAQRWRGIRDELLRLDRLVRPGTVSMAEDDVEALIGAHLRVSLAEAIPDLHDPNQCPRRKDGHSCHKLNDGHNDHHDLSMNYRWTTE